MESAAHHPIFVGFINVRWCAWIPSCERVFGEAGCIFRWREGNRGWGWRTVATPAAKTILDFGIFLNARLGELSRGLAAWRLVMLQLSLSAWIIGIRISRVGVDHNDSGPFKVGDQQFEIS